MADTREPSPRSGRVFKRGKVEKDKKDKTKSPGQQLEDSGDFIDDGTLDQQGNPNLQYRNALKILQAVPMKAAQAGRLALSIAGFGRLRGI